LSVLLGWAFGIEALKNIHPALIAGVASVAVASLLWSATTHLASRERLHRKVAAERAWLASLVQSSEDAILSTDSEGIVCSWNPAAERLYGYCAQEALGRPVAFLYPEDRHEEYAALRRRLLQGEPIPHLETVRRRKDGSEVPVSYSFSPIYDAGGQIVGFSA